MTIDRAYEICSLSCTDPRASDGTITEVDKRAAYAMAEAARKAEKFCGCGCRRNSDGDCDRCIDADGPY